MPRRALAARVTKYGDAREQPRSRSAQYGWLDLAHGGEEHTVDDPSTITPELDRQLTRQREPIAARRALGRRGARRRGLDCGGLYRASHKRAEQQEPRHPQT